MLNHKILPGSAAALEELFNNQQTAVRPRDVDCFLVTVGETLRSTSTQTACYGLLLELFSTCG